MEQAKTVANIIAGVTFGEGQETGGKIPAYQFSMSNEDGTWAEAAVTKQGGKLLWYMSPCKGNTEGKPLCRISEPAKTGVRSGASASEVRMLPKNI